MDWISTKSFLRVNWWRLLLVPLALILLYAMWKRWQSVQDSYMTWRKAVQRSSEIEAQYQTARENASARGELAVHAVEVQYRARIDSANEEVARTLKLSQQDRAGYEQFVNDAWGKWRSQ